MLMLHGATPRDREARDQLREVLPDAELTEPDQLGVFEITVEAEDLKSALSVSGMPWRPPGWTTTSCSRSTRNCPSTGAPRAGARSSPTDRRARPARRPWARSLAALPAWA